MRFAIVGYGRFGQLWTELLSDFGEVIIYDKKNIVPLHHKNITIVNISDLATADIVFILTPISLFENACQGIKNFLNSKSIIVDCCSVKIYPVHIMQKVFTKDQSLIATHPLFGPDSFKKNNSVKGYKIVVCPIQCNETQLNQLNAIFKKMGLTVLITTPEDHDKQMANSQGLIHFIGRGLQALELTEQELATPDFIALLNINKMVTNDTWQLFIDMHQYNPYTKAIREKLLFTLNNINDKVNNST